MYNDVAFSDVYDGAAHGLGCAECNVIVGGKSLDIRYLTQGMVLGAAIPRLSDLSGVGVDLRV